MQKVIERVNKLYREAYPKHRALFAKLARNQEPGRAVYHLLRLSCRAKSVLAS